MIQSNIIFFKDLPKTGVYITVYSEELDNIELKKVLDQIKNYLIINLKQFKVTSFPLTEEDDDYVRGGIWMHLSNSNNIELEEVFRDATFTAFNKIKKELGIKY